MKLIDNALKSLHVQDYSKRQVIDGVKIFPLRRFNDEGGSLTELVRLNKGKIEGDVTFNIAQINYSEIEPGVIKAFHIHEHQSDIWFVPPHSKVLLILVDQRDGSPTTDVIMKIVLGDCNSQLVLIPPGVAHGCLNLSNRRSTIVYFVDRKFSSVPGECDEKRLPWDNWGEEIWETPKE